MSSACSSVTMIDIITHIALQISPPIAIIVHGPHSADCQHWNYREADHSPSQALIWVILGGGEALTCTEYVTCRTIMSTTRVIVLRQSQHAVYKSGWTLNSISVSPGMIIVSKHLINGATFRGLFYRFGLSIDSLGSWK